jgi:hypothetical protein
MANRKVNNLKAHRTALFVIGFVISCLMVPKFSAMANDIRGYEATGGEVLIPLLYLLVAALIREIGGGYEQVKRSASGLLNNNRQEK